MTEDIQVNESGVKSTVEKNTNHSTGSITEQNTTTTCDDDGNCTTCDNKGNCKKSEGVKIEESYVSKNKTYIIVGVIVSVVILFILFKFRIRIYEFIRGIKN